MNSLPASFLRRTEPLFGSERFNAFLRAMADDPTVSIRLNRLKRPATACQDSAPIDQDSATAGRCLLPGAQQVPWCADGFYLPGRPSFTFDPLFHAGCYYVQEASSMFLAQVLGNLSDRPLLCLDLCAAPGGKSTLMRQVLPDDALLVSNEPVRLRATILSENMQKQGHPHCVVTSNYPRDFQRTRLRFDLILADVPCSGEGMFRKDDESIAQWSEAHVEQCSQLQRDIVADIWPCLKAGGLMVYSTCTFNTQENEENVQWICNTLGAEPLAVPTQESWGITGSLLPGFDGPAYRFIPGYTRGEGLFVCLLRKTADDSKGQGKDDSWERASALRSSKVSKTRRDKRVADKPVRPVSQWLSADRAFELQSDGTILRALPQAWADTCRQLLSSMNVLHAGVKLGEAKGRDFIPDQCLALSCSLKKDAFATAELTDMQALAYLHRESVTLPADAPRGFVLVTYRGLPLGFVKNIGSRANNLYPQAWTIRTSHLPTVCERVI